MLAATPVSEILGGGFGVPWHPTRFAGVNIIGGGGGPLVEVQVFDFNN